MKCYAKPTRIKTTTTDGSLAVTYVFLTNIDGFPCVSVMRKRLSDSLVMDENEKLLRSAFGKHLIMAGMNFKIGTFQSILDAVRDMAQKLTE